MKTIVCFAKSDYDNPLWTNRQQIMKRLSRNNRIVYVGGMVSFVREVLELGPLKALRGLFRCDIRDGNVIVYRERYFLPKKIVPLKFAWKAYALLNAFCISTVLKREAPGKYFIWIYSPEAYWYVRWLRNGTGVCYDCVDEYKEQPSYIESYPAIARYERRLLKIADCVFTTTTRLHEAKSPYNENTHYVPNVADFTLFNRVAEDAPPVSNRMKVGFWGAIDTYKMDFELLERVIRSRTDIDFILMGPVGLCENAEHHPVDAIKALPNAEVCEPVPQSDLPSVIRAFSVLIIPYRINEYTKNCFPLKFYEYMATGRPLVVSGLPELEKFGDMIWYTNDADEFAGMLTQAVMEDTAAARMQRIRLAAENTWEHRIDAILDVINRSCPGTELCR